jgi:hypothetical protein
LKSIEKEDSASQGKAERESKMKKRGGNGDRTESKNPGERLNGSWREKSLSIKDVESSR